MSALGAFTFVLHSHLPYARLAGRWPHGEEWIHEAACECYIPLLETLYDLVQDQVPFKLTLGITPVLAEQLADPVVLDHLEQYLDARIQAAETDIRYFDGQPLDAFQPMVSGSAAPTDQIKTGSEARQTAERLSETGGESRRETVTTESPKSGATMFHEVSSDEAHLRSLAEWYRAFYVRVKDSFRNRFNRDLIGAFRRLQDEGYIEIITSAATHAYLPLLGRDGTINAELKAGIASYERCFGRRPTGIWLPECAYRPAYYNSDKELRPGLEHFLAKEGLKVFFSEAHAITGGQPVGVAAGDVIGPYGNIKRRYVIPMVYQAPRRQTTTYLPYYVSDTTGGPDREEHSGVAVIGRNERTGQQVWSNDWGYPGDFDYREFHKKAGTSGLQYWRVTGAKTDLAHKDLYHPDWAAYKVEQHAEHFAHLVGDLIRDYHHSTGGYGLISSNYDTELFGHWWFEGVLWLGKVLRHLARDPDVELTTASQHIHEHPPTEVLDVPESSWGAGGTHFTWNNAETHWMWSPIYEAEVRMEEIARRYPSPGEDERIVLNQLARELLLVVSSDWPFLVTTGQAREYAIQRFSQHLERFNRLADTLDSGHPDRALAEELYEIDKLFPDIDYHWFAT